MPIEPELVRKKLDTLAEWVRQIEHMDFDEAGILENVDIQHLLSFRLQQAVETAIDIATHILAAIGSRQETALDAFETLGKEKVITSDLAKRMGLASKFRNLVVHGYGKIDFSKVYYNYKEDLDDLREFAGQVYEFMKKQTVKI